MAILIQNIASYAQKATIVLTLMHRKHNIVPVSTKSYKKGFYSCNFLRILVVGTGLANILG
jgi:hypothetical protein